MKRLILYLRTPILVIATILAFLTGFLIPTGSCFWVWSILDGIIPSEEWMARSIVGVAVLYIAGGISVLIGCVIGFLSAVFTNTFVDYSIPRKPRTCRLSTHL